MLLIRSARTALLPVFLLSGAGASAADYSITYAIDANGKTSTGQIETCDYEKSCAIEPPGFGLQIYLSFTRPDHRGVDLFIIGPPACCYSSDATREFYLQIKPGLLRVPIYQGRARRGNEFVQNHKLGMLYLEFSNLR
jgi:hypothetical protein